MELIDLKQELIANLQAGVKEIGGNTAIEAIVADAIAKIKVASDRDEVDQILDAMNEQGKKIIDEIKASQPKIAPGVQEIAEALKSDYQEETEKWQWYGVLETDENGNSCYTADYDGSKEAGNTGENFTGRKFVMPSLQEVLTQITPEQAKLFKAMQAAGEKPHLHLTPLALQIRTLAAKLDAKQDKIEPLKQETYVWEEIKDEELIYEAQSFKAINDGKKLAVANGLTKSEYIKKYQGWAIEIIATKQNLDEIKHGTNAEKTEAFMSEAIQKGYRGLTFESYLSAQMRKLKHDPEHPLDNETFTITPDSSLTKKKNIAGARWDDARVGLSGSVADRDGRVLRCRRLVRVGYP